MQNVLFVFQLQNIIIKYFLYKFLLENVSHKLERYIVSSAVSIGWYVWPSQNHQNDRHTIDSMLTKENCMTWNLQW